MSEFDSDNKSDPKSDNPEIYQISKTGNGYHLSRRDFVKIAGAVIATTTVGCDQIESAIQPPTETVPPSKTPLPPTKTLTPTKTSTPTKTATATITPTATPCSVEATTATQGINVRIGPGTQFYSLGSLPANAKVRIIGLLNDESWVHVVVDLSYFPNLQNAPIAKGGTVKEIDAWIKTSTLDFVEGSLACLPIHRPEPTPTDLPNKSPTGEKGIKYSYTDPYGNVKTYTLPCGSPIPNGAICTCNCVSLCSCVSYVAPTATKKPKGGGGTICTCDLVTYWYPN